MDRNLHIIIPIHDNYTYTSKLKAMQGDKESDS